MEKRFKTRVEGLKKKAANLSTLCGVDVCLVVFRHGSQTPTAVWPDGDQTWKAESVGRRYLHLPPKQPTPSGSYDDHQQLYDPLGGFSEEGLRDVARVLEGKLEEAKRKMEAVRRRPSPARKSAKVGTDQSGMTSPGADDAVVSNYSNNGTINGGSADHGGSVLDDEAFLLAWAMEEGLI